MSTLFDEWPWLKKLGLGGVHVQSGSRHSGVYGLNYLAVGHLLREKTTGFRAFVTGYAEKFFGPEAGPVMAKLIFRWEERMRHADIPHVHSSPFFCLNPVFRPEDLAYCRDRCGEALAATDDPVFRWRIERIYSLLVYTGLWSKAERFWTLKKDNRLSERDKQDLGQWLGEMEAFTERHLALDDGIFDFVFGGNFLLPRLRQMFTAGPKQK